jgi:hypothetical protein
MYAGNMLRHGAPVPTAAIVQAIASLMTDRYACWGGNVGKRTARARNTPPKFRGHAIITEVLPWRAGSIPRWSTAIRLHRLSRVGSGWRPLPQGIRFIAPTSGKAKRHGVGQKMKLEKPLRLERLPNRKILAFGAGCDQNRHMLWSGLVFLSLLLPAIALAQTPIALHANYVTYATGMHVADVSAGLNFGPRTYQISLGYRTTGLAGWFVRGHQLDWVSGSWHNLQAMPTRFVGKGTWRDIDRQAVIEYQSGAPVVSQLVPPNDLEREAVPDGLRANTVDTLSALADLIRVVDLTGRCEASARIFDGRRAVEVAATTVGEEDLRPTDRSSFAGKALRCDFSGQIVAGFLLGESHAREGKLMRGSAWLAPIIPSGSRLPVRLTFETKWFGQATMYLTHVGLGSDGQVTQGH